LDLITDTHGCKQFHQSDKDNLEGNGTKTGKYFLQKSGSTLKGKKDFMNWNGAKNGEEAMTGDRAVVRSK